MKHEPQEDAALWERTESVLRRKRPASDEAIERVMSRVRALSVEPLPRERNRVVQWLTRRRAVSVSPLHLLAALLVLAVGLSSLVLSGSRGDAAGEAQGAGASPAPTAAIATTSNDALRPVQFLFSAKDARRVTIAGDFNDWNPTATPLRSAGNGVWSVVIPLEPGRHLYTFVVDGERWVPDESAPRAPETEFGAESSVVLVERGS